MDPTIQNRPRAAFGDTAGLIDTRDLRQIALKINEERLPRLLDQLSSGSIQASTEREKFRNSARWLDEAANKLAGALEDSQTPHTESETASVQYAQEALARDRDALSKNAVTVANNSEKLGAAESTLIERLRVVVELIRDFTSKLGVTENPPPLDSFALSDRNSSISGGSPFRMGSPVAEYFDKVADVQIFQEQIASLEKERKDGLDTRAFLWDSGRSPQQSEGDFERSFTDRRAKLQAELQRTQRRSDELKAQCERKGIDLQKARWRGAGSPEMRNVADIRSSHRHLQNWLERLQSESIDGEGAFCTTLTPSNVSSSPKQILSPGPMTTGPSVSTDGLDRQASQVLRANAIDTHNGAHSSPWPDDKPIPAALTFGDFPARQIVAPVTHEPYSIGAKLPATQQESSTWKSSIYREPQHGDVGVFPSAQIPGRLRSLPASPERTTAVPRISQSSNRPRDMQLHHQISQVRATTRESITSTEEPSRMNTLPEWTWDHRAQLYYYYDAGRNALVYQDGNLIPYSPASSLQQMHVPPLFEQPRSARSDFERISKQYSGTSLPAISAVDSVLASSHAGYSNNLPFHIAQPSLNSSSMPYAPYSQASTQGQAHASMNYHASNPDARRSAQDQAREYFDSRSATTTRVQTGPKEAITDPELYRRGIMAYRSLGETAGDFEELDPRFKKRKSSFFCVGRVFLTLWAEPAGGAGLSGSTSASNQTIVSNIEIFKGRFGESVYHKVRRFVVIRPGSTHCTALPILTYGGQGVAKHGIKKSDHAIIYSGKDAPVPTNNEQPMRGEDGMRTTSIRVHADDKNEKLDPRSRLDFGKPHTIHHALKVRNFGSVSEKSLQSLLYQFQAVWTSDVRSHDQPRAGPAGTTTDEHLMAELVKRGYSRKQAQAILEKRSRDLKTKARKEAAEASDDEDGNDSEDLEESSDDESWKRARQSCS